MQKYCPNCGVADLRCFFQIYPYERESDSSILNNSFDKDCKLHVHQMEPYAGVFGCNICDSRFVHFYKDTCPVKECEFNRVELCQGGICKLLKSGE